MWAGLPRPIDMDALKGFLAEFPNGKRASEARAELGELESRAAVAREAEERERDAWASATEAGSVAAFEAFRKNWPGSRHADAASKLIKEIQDAPSRRWLFQGIGASAGVVFAGLALAEMRPGFLFWRLLHESIRIFRGHSDGVISVVFSPDGQAALSGSCDRTLRLWDIATGKEIRSFSANSDCIGSVSFSPDGRFALSGSWDNTLKLWDVATGKEIRTFSGHTGSVFSVAFSSDGRTALSGSADHTLGLWDVGTGKEIRTFTGHTNMVASGAFSPDALSALSGSADDNLILWDLTGR